MNLVTIDSIIRTYIIERGLVWHDYFRLLTIAIQGVKKLAEDIDIGTNVKAEYIDVDATGRLQVPATSTQVIGVYVENGDKILPLSREDTINPLTKLNEAGDPVKRGVEERLISDNVTLTEIGYFYYNNANDKGEWLGREFGRPSNQPWNYQQFNGEIQLDTALNLDCVLVLYNTNGLKVSEANVIHPLAEQAIKFYMDWNFTDRGVKKGIWEKQNDGKAYYNEKRALYGRISGLTWSEYLKTVRELQVNAPKY